MMNRDYITKFDKWFKNIDNKSDKLILTSDIDSLASCYLLNLLFSCEVKGFYDFSSIYFVDTNDKKGYIGVDLDATKNARVFGNHVTYFNNERAISLNKDITRFNYTEKFAGSTLISIMSVYDIDINQFTTEQLEVLISIDTAFKQYFFNANLFKKWYIDILEYPEFVDIVQGHDKEHFYKIIRKYKLHEQIYIDNEGYLHTDIDLKGLSKLFNINLKLPTEQFYKYREFKNVGVDLNKINSKSLNKKKIFSSALVRKNFLKMSIV